MRLLSVIALATVVAGCNTSYNYFEDDRSGMPAGTGDTAFGAILGLTGVAPTKKPPIEYERRAPLAMPPGRDLPPPQQGAVAEGVDWPNDPDAAEEARRRASRAAGETTAAYENSYRESDDARLSPEDIQDGRLAGGGLERREDPYDTHRNRAFRLSPRELAKTIPGLGNRDTEILSETGEVRPRRYLVEPPDTYRTPSDSAPLPEPGDIENSDWAKDRLYRTQTQRKPPRAL